MEHKVFSQSASAAVSCCDPASVDSLANNSYSLDAEVNLALSQHYLSNSEHKKQAYADTEDFYYDDDDRGTIMTSPVTAGRPALRNEAGRSINGATPEFLSLQPSAWSAAVEHAESDPSSNNGCTESFAPHEVSQSAECKKHATSRADAVATLNGGPSALLVDDSCVESANVLAADGLAACCVAANEAGLHASYCLATSKKSWPIHELDEDDIMALVTDGFRFWADETRHCVAQMEQRLSLGRSASEDAHAVTLENRPKVWEGLVAEVTSFNRQILTFSKSCPGFELIAPMDKVALVKRAFFCIWLVSKAELFVDGETHLLLCDQTVYTRAWMTTFLPESFVENMHAYAKRQNAAGLSVRELSLMCAIILMSRYDVELTNTQSADHIKELLVHALVFEVNKSRVNPSEILAEITGLLQDLVDISKKQDLIFSQSLDATS